MLNNSSRRSLTTALPIMKIAISINWLTAVATSLLLFFFVLPHEIVAQSETQDIARIVADLRARFNLSEEQVSQLRPLIERQAEKLQNIFSKYSSIGEAFEEKLRRGNAAVTGSGCFEIK
jgi:hypothetical protein